MQVHWTGNTGEGTRRYGAYTNAHDILAEDKRIRVPGSSDPGFGGDASCYNPEELLVAALAACHMMCYLHLCADAGVVVVDYTDQPTGALLARRVGGHFTEVTLHPQVTVAAGSSAALAEQLHEQAHARCFVANSMNFSVRFEPRIRVGGADSP